MKEKFRKFWMASMADGFKDDLEQIRKVGHGYLSDPIDRYPKLIPLRNPTWGRHGSHY